MYKMMDFFHCNHLELKTSIYNSLFDRFLPAPSVCMLHKYPSHCDSEYVFHHEPFANQMKTTDLKSFPGIQKSVWFCLNAYEYSKNWHHRFDSVASKPDHWVHVTAQKKSPSWHEQALAHVTASFPKEMTTSRRRVSKCTNYQTTFSLTCVSLSL